MITEQIQDLPKKFLSIRSVKKVILFGSRARGDHDERSDIDLAIAGDITDHEWLQICEMAENTDTLLEIDLVRLNTASEALKTEIAKHGQVIYER